VTNTVRAFLLGSGSLGSGDPTRPGDPMRPGDLMRRGDQDEAMASRLLAGALAGPLASVSPAAAQLVERAAAGLAGRLLDLDLADLLAAGWRKHAALAEAARITAADPAREQVVDLAAHRVTCTHSPALEIQLDGVKVATVDFELRVAFTVVGLAAAVREGRLVGLRSGRCELSVTLSAEGIPVVERNAEVDLAVMIPLGDGVPLVPAAEPAAPARPIGRVRMFRR
jgi:hypothetical protein